MYQNFCELQKELEKIFNKKVDLIEKGTFDYKFRSDNVREYKEKIKKKYQEVLFMSKMKNKYLDFSDYFNDEEKVSKEDKAIIELETLLIGKKIKEKNIESEYDLKIYKEYLKQKEEGTLKTYSHKEVWKE